MSNYSTKYEDGWELCQDVTLLALYSVTVVLALFGNLLVCYVAFVLRSKSTTYLLIGNMAVSDLISGLVIPAQWLFCSSAWLDRDERLCGAFKSLQVMSYFISTFTMAVIAIDRFLLLYRPLAQRVPPLSSIAAIWVTSFLLNIPTFFELRVPEYFTHDKLIHCRIIFIIDSVPIGYIRRFRVSLIVLSQYVIPLLIACTFYSLCIKKILCRQQIGEATDQQEINFYRSKMRTIKMLLLSLFAFMVAWLPVHTVHLIDFYLQPLPIQPCNSTFLYNLSYWLAISSCCYNPFIYCWFDKKFRSSSRKLCCLRIRYGLARLKWKAHTSESSLATQQYKSGQNCIIDFSTG